MATFNPTAVRTAVSQAVVVWAALVAGWLWPNSLAAQEGKKPSLLSVRMGYEDIYKAGHWAPLSVTLRGGSESVTGTLEVSAVDGDGLRAVFRSENPILVPAGRDVSSTLIVKTGQLDVRMTVRLMVDGRAIVRENVDSMLNSGTNNAVASPIPTNHEVILNIGTSLGLEEATGEETRQAISASDSLHIINIKDASLLPTKWHGYDTVDHVILSGDDASVFQSMSLASGQMAALEDWVKRGGRLLVCADGATPETLPFNTEFNDPARRERTEPLALFCPGKPVDVVKLTSLAALEEFSDTQVPFPPDTSVLVPRLVNTVGVVDLAVDNVPLVIRYPLGFGEVVFVAVNLSREPFTSWSSRRQLLNRLLTRTEKRGNAADAENFDFMTQNVNSRYGDLAGPLRRSLDSFPGVRPVHFWLVALLICGYIALAGPGDYLFLKFIVRKMEWTWFTFPVLVLVMSVGAYALAYWLKGNQLRVNQFDVVDVDTSTGMMRGTTFVSIFSPKTNHFNLSAKPKLPSGEAIDGEVTMSWFGLPDEAIGAAMGAGSSPVWSKEYSLTPDLRQLQEMPVQVWSTKGVGVRWFYDPVTHTSDPTPSANVSADLSPGSGYDLRGSITNGLPVALENCILVYSLSTTPQSDSDTDIRGYNLGRLAPGQTLPIGEINTAAPEKLRNVFSEPVLQEEQSGRFFQQMDTYNPRSTTPFDHLREMLFYEAVRAEDFTALQTRDQRFLDLSRQLQMGTAVLLARVKQPGVNMLSDDEPLSAHQADVHETYVRFLLRLTLDASNRGPATPDKVAPGGHAPSDETPGTETPGTETPGTETPGTETPGTETPAGETPTTPETPASETVPSGDAAPAGEARPADGAVANTESSTNG